ncbi:unnamed protein product [Amoebophrya sp. A120]|nr:unnamed protein product [Amoebophrya sp. A120]|eukprot:GSA120T00022178001.1
MLLAIWLRLFLRGPGSLLLASVQLQLLSSSSILAGVLLYHVHPISNFAFAVHLVPPASEGTTGGSTTAGKNGSSATAASTSSTPAGDEVDQDVDDRDSHAVGARSSTEQTTLLQQGRPRPDDERRDYTRAGNHVGTGVAAPSTVAEQAVLDYESGGEIISSSSFRREEDGAFESSSSRGRRSSVASAAPRRAPAWSSTSFTLMSMIPVGGAGETTNQNSSSEDEENHNEDGDDVVVDVVEHDHMDDENMLATTRSTSVDDAGELVHETTPDVVAVVPSSPGTVSHELVTADHAEDEDEAGVTTTIVSPDDDDDDASARFPFDFTTDVHEPEQMEDKPPGGGFLQKATAPQEQLHQRRQKKIERKASAYASEAGPRPWIKQTKLGRSKMSAEQQVQVKAQVLHNPALTMAPEVKDYKLVQPEGTTSGAPHQEGPRTGTSASSSCCDEDDGINDARVNATDGGRGVARLQQTERKLVRKVRTTPTLLFYKRLRDSADDRDHEKHGLNRTRIDPIYLYKASTHVLKDLDTMGLDRKIQAALDETPTLALSDVVFDLRMSDTLRAVYEAREKEDLHKYRNVRDPALKREKVRPWKCVQFLQQVSTRDATLSKKEHHNEVVHIRGEDLSYPKLWKGKQLPWEMRLYRGKDVRMGSCEECGIVWDPPDDKMSCVETYKVGLRGEETLLEYSTYYLINEETRAADWFNVKLLKDDEQLRLDVIQLADQESGGCSTCCCVVVTLVVLLVVLILAIAAYLYFYRWGDGDAWEHEMDNEDLDKANTDDENINTEADTSLRSLHGQDPEEAEQLGNNFDSEINDRSGQDHRGRGLFQNKMPLPSPPPGFSLAPENGRNLIFSPPVSSYEQIQKLQREQGVGTTKVDEDAKQKIIPQVVHVQSAAENVFYAPTTIEPSMNTEPSLTSFVPPSGLAGVPGSIFAAGAPLSGRGGYEEEEEAPGVAALALGGQPVEEEVDHGSKKTPLSMKQAYERTRRGKIGFAWEGEQLPYYDGGDLNYFNHDGSRAVLDSTSSSSSSRARQGVHKNLRGDEEILQEPSSGAGTRVKILNTRDEEEPSTGQARRSSGNRRSKGTA